MNKNHWIALWTTVGLQKACITIFDTMEVKSFPSYPEVYKCPTSNTRTLIFCWFKCRKDHRHDCGLFALVYITSICKGQDPAVLLYKQNAMRKHILKSIEDGLMTAFPTSASRLPKVSIRKNIPMYCICRHINDASKMIQCVMFASSGSMYM